MLLRVLNSRYYFGKTIYEIHLYLPLIFTLYNQKYYIKLYIYTSLSTYQERDIFTNVKFNYGIIYIFHNFYHHFCSLFFQII